MFCYKIFWIRDGNVMTSYAAPVLTEYKVNKPTVRDKDKQGPFACFDTLESLIAFVKRDYGNCEDEKIHEELKSAHQVFKCKIVPSTEHALWYLLKAPSGFTDYPMSTKMTRQELPEGTVFADEVTPIKKIENWWEIKQEEL